MTDDDRALLERLEAVLSDEAPLSDVPALFTDPVELHWDGRLLQSSSSGWSRWVTWMRTRGRVDGLTVRVDALEALPDGRILGTGCWRGRIDGQESEGPPVRVHYRVEGGRIAALWTGWHNYAWVFGVPPHRRWSAWWVLGRFALWSRLAGDP